MTPQERDIIGQFIARVAGRAPQIAGSVPSTQVPLPPIDPEADRYIGEQFASHPEARYRITQLAFVQEAALTEAQNRIKRLEYDLQTAQQQAQAAPQQGQSRGLFGGLFGGGQTPPPRPAYQQQYAPPPPQPVYAQGGYQPGMFGAGGGSGFLGSALTTAAGVAGGVLAADAISSMFSPHGYGMGGGFGGGGFGGMGGGWGGGGGEVINETTVNNYGDAGGGGGADPWSGGGTSDPGSWDQGASDPGPADTGGDWGGGGDSGGDAGWDDSGGGGDSSF
jgi:hypothetical protein